MRLKGYRERVEGGNEKGREERKMAKRREGRKRKSERKERDVVPRNKNEKEREGKGEGEDAMIIKEIQEIKDREWTITTCRTRNKGKERK